MLTMLHKVLILNTEQDESPRNCFESGYLKLSQCILNSSMQISELRFGKGISWSFYWKMPIRLHCRFQFRPSDAQNQGGIFTIFICTLVIDLGIFNVGRILETNSEKVCSVQEDVSRFFHVFSR